MERALLVDSALRIAADDAMASMQKVTEVGGCTSGCVVVAVANHLTAAVSTEGWKGGGF